MQTSTRRVCLYGGAVPLLAALSYGGFVYRAAPDVGTLLSAANMQLRFAHGTPSVDRDGEPTAWREELLALAERNLDEARAQDPDSPIVAEFDGFLCMLRDRPLEAAAHYRRARGLPGCSPGQRDTLTFNEARMLAAAGKPQAALDVYAAATALAPALQPQAGIEQAELLFQLARKPEAATRLQQATAALDTAARAAPALDGSNPGDDASMAWLSAGVLWDRMGRRELAEPCLERAAATVPIADYYLARLKLTGGDVDTSLRLLTRATKAVPAEVRRLLREDAAVWQTLAEDARFAALTGPGPATPGR